MTVALKSEYRHHQLLQSLVEEFNSLAQHSRDYHAIVQKYAHLIGNESNLDSLDNMIGLDMYMLKFPAGTSYYDRMATFVKIQEFLYKFRRTYIQLSGLPHQTEYVLTGRQQRVISPGLEAFEPMGNNKLDIRESPLGYRLIVE